MERVKGYVHNVSPTKRGKNGKTTYFNFHLQTTDDNYKRAVCFQSDMHNTLTSFQDSQTPVKFTNSRKSSAADDDIYFNKRFVIAVLMLVHFIDKPSYIFYGCIADLS